jgi:hypothetical protein
MANVIAETCIRLPALSRALRADRIDRPVEVGAWTDAALALIELELPTGAEPALHVETARNAGTFSLHFALRFVAKTLLDSPSPPADRHVGSPHI